MPAAIAGPLTLNGPRTRLTASMTWAGADHPAEAQIGKAIDLREGARHHHVLGGRDEFEARLVVVAADIFGIGRVEHQHHVRRQARMQALDLVERQIGAGRIVGIGEEHDLGLAASPARASRRRRRV